jgi:hypothetical protein
MQILQARGDANNDVSGNWQRGPRVTCSPLVAGMQTTWLPYSRSKRPVINSVEEPVMNTPDMFGYLWFN